MQIEGTKELDETREEQKQTETQEEEQIELNEEEEKAREAALVELLGKVNLNDPVVVEDARGNEVAITKQQIIDYYLPEGTNQLEAFHCVQQLRASGLNILIKGQCYFVRFGDGPLSLYTGYEVYLARAYSNGMEHMEEPVWEIGEDGLPLSCTLTIDIKGRKPFTRTTRYAEVVAMKNNQPNSRWKRAPFQMTEKCTIVNTLRLAGIAAVESLPYAVEEMGDPVVPGYKTLTKEQLDTLGIEEGKAEPGKVTATDHQIDTDKARRTYRAIIAEQKVFPDDVLRKKCQEHFTDKASTGDFDHDDYLTMFAALSSGKVAQWVQDNKPKPDPPDKPEGMGGFSPEMTQGISEAIVQEAKARDDFLENSPDVPPKHEFLFEGDKRFATIEKFAAWCKERISPISWDDWTDENFVVALPRLLEVPLLAAQNATDDTAQSDTQRETAEGQERSITPGIKSAARKALSLLVKTFPGSKYMTVASASFRERAVKDIGRKIASMSDLTHADVLKITESLEAEKVKVLQDIADRGKLAEAEKFKADLVAGKEEETEQEASEDTEAWFDSPEYAETLNAYMIRAAGHFADAFKTTAWHQEQLELNGSPRFWPKADFAQANAALDELDLAETTRREPAVGIADEQKDKIKELMEEILPRTLNPHLSPYASGWISEAIGYRSPGIVALSKSDAAKVIVFLDQKLAERQQAGSAPA